MICDLDREASGGSGGGRGGIKVRRLQGGWKNQSNIRL